LQFCILSLSTLLQDPEPAPGTAAVSSPPRIEVQNLAGWLPENAVATLLVQPLAGSSTVLETSPMVRLWNDESFAATRQLLSRGIGQIGTGLGLPTATLLELAGNGFAFGIAEGDGGDRPEVLLALVLGNAEAAVRSASARWSTGEGLHSAAGTAFSRLKDAPLLYGILRGCLVVCSNIAQIDAAEARFAAGTGADLASNPGQAPPLVRFRLALDRLQQLVERRLPPPWASAAAGTSSCRGR
jgi:hypothetical protein